MPIPVVCAVCETKLLAPDAAARKRVVCKGCGAILTVPPLVLDAEVLEYEEGFQPPPAPKVLTPKRPVSAMGDDDEEEEAEEIRPKRRRPKQKRKRKKAGVHPAVWVGVGVAVVLFLAVGGLGLRYALREGRVSAKDSSEVGGSTANDPDWVVDAGELKRLQGRWRATHVSRGLDVISKQILDREPMIFHVEGNRMTMSGLSGPTVVVTIVNLNPRKEPKPLDTRGVVRGDVERSHYTLNGDEWSLTSFVNGDEVHATFRRER